MPEKQYMFELAKRMLKNSYSPYSKFQVSCCLRTDKGNYYAGCNVENASYSLVCCAEASAICQMVANGEQKIVEVLIISSGDLACTPCGACRQRLREFADNSLVIYVGTKEKISASYTLSELLPHSFGPNHLN